MFNDVHLHKEYHKECMLQTQAQQHDACARMPDRSNISQGSALSASVQTGRSQAKVSFAGCVSLRISREGGHNGGRLHSMCLGAAALIPPHHDLKLLTAAQLNGQLREHLA